MITVHEPEENPPKGKLEDLPLFVRRFFSNADRVHILYLSPELKALHSPPLAIEILRAAVVLEHAMMEDLLRGFGAIYLPRCQKTVLDKIPLAGMLSANRAEKFQLGDLCQFSQQKVEDLILESVKQYLSKKSFNGVRDIVEFFGQVGIDKASFEPIFEELETAIKRRHQIAHNADLPEDDHLPLLTLESGAEMIGSVDAVLDFCDLLFINQWERLKGYISMPEGKFLEYRSLTGRYRLFNNRIYKPKHRREMFDAAKK